MEPSERLERFERALLDLVETSEAGVPIVVEGVNDERALRSLGVAGKIIIYNRVGSIITFADHVRTHRRLVLLFDWDRKGGHLTQLVKNQLSGLVELDFDARREFSQTSLVRCVEDLPAARATLRRRALRHADEEEFTPP